MTLADEDRLPRVAVVSANPICDHQSNGMFMRSLFLGWPRDRLAQVYFPTAVVHLPDATVCGQYRLIHLSGRVRCMGGAEASGAASAQKTPHGGLRGSRPWLRRTVARVTRQRWLMHWLRPGVELWRAHSRLAPILERELRQLRPDVVYALLGNYCLTKITYLACKRLGIPLFVHVTDDFVTSLYGETPFASRFQAVSERWFRRAVGHADGLAAISPVMAEEYGRRYGKQWSWFTTLIDAGAYDPSPRPADGTIRLVYAGNLELDRWRSLRDLAAAIQTLRDDEGIDARLDIYSPPEQIDAYRDALHAPPVTNFRGWLSPERLPRVFHEADVLVHAEGFDPAVADYTRLSFSTKLSQYMMAGRSILMFGPYDVGSARMIRTADGGVTIGCADPTAVQGALRRLFLDASSRQRHGENGRRCALEWFEATTGRQRFRRALTEAFERSRGKSAGSPQGIPQSGSSETKDRQRV